MKKQNKYVNSYYFVDNLSKIKRKDQQFKKVVKKKLLNFIKTFSNKNITSVYNGKFNPFFYNIDGFRYAFIGKSDSSLFIGGTSLIILNIILIYLCYLMFRSGYKLKS